MQYLGPIWIKMAHFEGYSFHEIMTNATFVYLKWPSLSETPEKSLRQILGTMQPSILGQIYGVMT